jgi:transcriptional regulator with XRE-family HTH domain
VQYLAYVSKRVALPKAIRTIREAKQLPGARVAIAALMSHAHLINIEAGRRRATDESIELLAAALGVDIDAISYEAPSEAVA